MLEKTLESPWTTRRSNKSMLTEINLAYSLEGLMLKLKLQYFGHPMGKVDSLEKTLILGKIEGRRRGQQRMRWLDVTTDSMDMSLSKLQEMVKDREAWHVTVHGVGYNLMTEQQHTPYGNDDDQSAFPHPTNISPHLPETHSVWE